MAVLNLHGQGLERDGDVLVVEVLGRNSLGTHVSGTVRVTVPEMAR
ncbi:hypothetical protein [Saccharopolyspora pogona]|nr:hypothetical protein [Saccharopolyspora pogona]